MSFAPHVAVIITLALLAAGPSNGEHRSLVDRTAQGTSGSPRATWEKRLIEAVRPKPFGVRYEIAISESPVPAATRDEFVRALGAATRDIRSDRTSPTRAPGSGKYRISWVLKPEVHLSECGFKDVSINIEYTIDVAQLAGPLAEDSTARTWWAGEVERAFTARVETLKTMRDGSKDLQRKLMSMNSNTCSNLVELANTSARMAVEDIYAGLERPRPAPER